MTNDLKEEIYNHDKKIQSLIKKLENNSVINPKNKQLILEYRNNALANGRSKARQEIVLQALYRVADAAKDIELDKSTRKDMEKIFAELNGREYAAWTIQTIIAVTKAFFRWMHSLESNDPLPDNVRWLKRTTPPVTITKSDLLSKQDVAAMMSVTTDIMQKCLISTHFESCNRPSESLLMHCSDCQFFDNYALIRVGGKMKKTMGYSEKYLLQSYDLLKMYVESHPLLREGRTDAPLWVVSTHMRKKRSPKNHDGMCWKCQKKTDLANAKREIIKINKKDHEAITCVHCGADLNLEDLYGKVISLQFMQKIFVNAAKKAGIKKQRIYPYLTRHSRGTYLFGLMGNLAEKQLSHVPGSRSNRFYNHLNSNDLLIGLQKANGIVDKKNEEQSEKCWKCGHMNGFEVKTCTKCASPLNLESAMEKGCVNTFDISTFNPEQMAKLYGMMKEVMREMNTGK